MLSGSCTEEEVLAVICYPDIRWLHWKPGNIGLCPQRLNFHQTAGSWITRLCSLKHTQPHMKLLQGELCQFTQLYRTFQHLSAHCFGLPATLLFWFTFTAFIESFSGAAGSCFIEKALKTHCALPTKLATIAGEHSGVFSS